MVNNKINNCMKVINLLFKFLGVIGAGFLGIMGVFTFITNVFGIFIAKVSLVVATVIIITILGMIYNRFATIKQMNLKG